MYIRVVNPGRLGVATPRFWVGWVVGIAGGRGVVDGWWNIIISYHIQEVCSKVVIF